MRLGAVIFLTCLSLLYSCDHKKQINGDSETIFQHYTDGKPVVRWWWFATEIKKEDVKYQLDWLKEHNFGGVEIAWVYPLYRYQRMYERKYDRHYPKDTSAQEWLSDEWSEMLAYTKAYADSIDMNCDFTFGSAWPVASSHIDSSQGTKIYGDSTFRQLLTFAWSWPDTLLVIDHLDSNAFKSFAEPIGKALEEALKGSKSALFTDSWEIKLNEKNKIWTDGFEKAFQDRFGYDVLPFMDAGLDSFPGVRYDYMLLLDHYVSEGFYKPFVRKCKELGAWSRVQCLASPTDVMTTYSLVDIPESESMLNNPNYSRIVSSSACLASKPMVSSETFTCMYGFPATYLREEQVADLKMVADAMFAKGVNQHFYHGYPYNPKGVDSIDFFATTYFGPGGSLEADLSDFNEYIAKVSAFMQEGKTYSDVAVYIPYEDGVMKGAYPPERQRVWVWGQYEMRYIEPPKELEGYHPLWINRHFLQQASWDSNKLKVGDATFSVLYVDVNFMDIRSLKRLLELAKEGLPICLKKAPKQPSHRRSEEYQKLLEELSGLENVTADLDKVIKHPPLIEGDSIPAYWCRSLKDGSYYLFLAQLNAKDLKYPVYSGQSLMKKAETLRLKINLEDIGIDQNFSFAPYESILLQIMPDGTFEKIDLSYLPPDPLVRPKEKQRMYF